MPRVSEFVPAATLLASLQHPALYLKIKKVLTTEILDSPAYKDCLWISNQDRAALPSLLHLASGRRQPEPIKLLEAGSQYAIWLGCETRRTETDLHCETVPEGEEMMACGRVRSFFFSSPRFLLPVRIPADPLLRLHPSLVQDGSLLLSQFVPILPRRREKEDRADPDSTRLPYFPQDTNEPIGRLTSEFALRLAGKTEGLGDLHLGLGKGDWENASKGTRRGSFDLMTV